MAIAFDAVGPSSAGAGGANPTSPVTWSHTCTGSNLVLFVGLAVSDRLGNQFTITGITYNGVALTHITSKGSGPDSQYGYADLWYLVNPATGANTVSVAFTRSNPEVRDAIEAGSISFTGVDQTTPYVVANTTTAAAAGPPFSAPSVAVTSSTGNIVLDIVANGSGITSSGQTNRWLKNVNNNASGGNGAQSTAAGAASVTMSYTTTNDWWGIIGVDVKAAGASAAVTGPFPTFRPDLP